MEEKLLFRKKLWTLVCPQFLKLMITLFYSKAFVKASEIEGLLMCIYDLEVLLLY